MILHGEPDKLKGLRPVRRGDAELSRKLEVRFLPYHLWGIDDPTFRWPIGWHQRRVTEVSIDGSKQAPFEEKPGDLMDEDTLRIRLEEDGLKELSLSKKVRKSREKEHPSGHESDQRDWFIRHSSLSARKQNQR
jgi:hypothetical protein